MRTTRTAASSTDAATRRADHRPGRAGGPAAGPRRSRPSGALLVPLLSLLSGCFGYVPVDVPTPGPGASVRATLAPPVDVSLADRTLSRVDRVDGEVVGLRGDTLVLWARVFDTDGVVRRVAAGAPLSLPRGTIRTLEARRLSSTRTALFVALTAAALFAVDRGLASWGSGSGEGGGGGPPQGQ